MSEYAELLAALEAADTSEEVYDALDAHEPPEERLARERLRDTLVSALAARKKAGVRVTPGRAVDAWLGAASNGAQLQGEAFTPDELEPWHEQVDGADLLDEVAALAEAYVYADAEKLTAIALWAVYAHLYDCFGTCPLLDVSSPTKRCGKSTVIVVLRRLCPAPLLSSNITPAALFRAVQAWRPTLLIDEADTFAKMSDELRGILNAGHTRDTAFTVRAEGDANEPRVFSTWAPKAVAAIGRLPDTIEDRCIRVVLARKPTEVQKLDAFDSDALAMACEPVRRRIARWAADAEDAVAVATPARPPGLNDRAWNNWRPLLAVASAAGPSWLARAEAAAIALSGDGATEEDVSTLALQHVREAIGEEKGAATEAVLAYLVAKEEGPWAKWWEADLANSKTRGPAARLASLLRPFGIKPGQLWLHGQKVRGYAAEDFEKAAAYIAVGDGRTGGDPTDLNTVGPSNTVGGSPADHAGSTVPTVPTVLFEPGEGVCATPGCSGRTVPGAELCDECDGIPF